MFHRYRLSNGIEVISEPMENRKTVALGIFIKVGSQDETRKNNGISHLTEHMFFKGTTTRSAKDIADLTASLGDDVNAFTSKECTALYGMTITEKLDELADLLGDLVANAKFDSKDLAKEKRIVMDEIDMYEDSPEDLVHELLQKRVWRDDALGFLISGTKSIVHSLHSEELHQFLKEYYYAENMLISAAGGYAEEILKDCLERAFAGVKIKGERKKELCITPDYHRSFASANKKIEQIHLNLAFPAPALGMNGGSSTLYLIRFLAAAIIPACFSRFVRRREWRILFILTAVLINVRDYFTLISPCSRRLQFRY